MIIFRAEAERQRRTQADAAAKAEEARRTTRINGPGKIADSQYYESEEIKQALIVFFGGVASIG